MANLTVQHLYYPGTKDDKPYDLVVFRIEFSDDDKPGIVTKPFAGKDQQNADIREIKLTYRGLRAKRKGEPPDPEQTDEIVWGFYGNNGETKVMSMAAHQKYMKGKLALFLKWGDRNGTEKTWEGEFASGNQLNSKQQITLISAVPRLSTLLGGPQLPLEEWAPSADALDPATDSAEMVAQVLKYIHDELTRGLKRFWLTYGPDTCKGDQPLRDIDKLDELSEAEREECWSQHITELVVGACYGGPGSAMLAPELVTAPKTVDASHKKDAWVLDKFARTNDPTHSLLFACQQLNSMVVISRGFTSLANNPFDADSYSIGDLPGKTLLDSTGNNPALFNEIVTDPNKVVHMEIAAHRWLPGESEGTNVPVLRPGTSFWVNKSRAAGEFVHCGGTLRAWKSDVAQLMDTGTWIWDDPLVASGGYMRDTVAVGTLSKDDKGCKGIVVPPEASTDQLNTAIEKMRQSRPLGVIRLVIRKRPASSNKSDIYWASTLLAMNEEASGTTPRQSYSISRLLAALRGVPHRKHFDVMLYIWVPHSEDACNAAVDVTTGREARSTKWWKRLNSAGKKMELTPLARILVSEDGISRLKEHIGQTTPTNWPNLSSFDNEPFGSYDGVRSQGYTSVPDMQSTATTVPEYFKGTTSTEPASP